MRRRSFSFVVLDPAGPPPPPTPFTVDYIALPVRDVVASAQWWATLLGWVRLYEYEDIHSDELPVVIGPAAGATARIGFLPLGDTVVVTPTRISIRTDRLTAQSLQHTLSEREIPYEVGGTSMLDDWVYVTDPDGHVLEITW